MSTSSRRAPVVLIIRDGWGQNPNSDQDHVNGIHRARTPIDDQLRQHWPFTLVRTSGEDVGLPTGTMGNSEVGHQNIGAGRIVDQELMRITRTIRDGSFLTRPAIIGAFEHATRTGGNVHLLGLVSRGRVHSDLAHAVGLIDAVKHNGFDGDRVFVHAITDGRDTGPATGLGFVGELEAAMRERGIGHLATVIGRFWAMDRDHRWQRIAYAYQCLTGRTVAHEKLSSAMQVRTAASAREAIQWGYDHPFSATQQGDEFILPTMIVDPATNEPHPRIADGDVVLFFNFRGDRPRQITRAFMCDADAWRDVQEGGFERGEPLRDLYFATMTGYEKNLPVTAVIFEKPDHLPMILGEAISQAGMTQFRCAETEKFAHVTFFMNDYRELPFEGEHRLLVPSPRDVPTYDQKPEMSAAGVCAGVLDRLRADDGESAIIVNFANPDMVGHTGSLGAVIHAVQTVDACVGEIVDATLARGGSVIITADHGNAEQMWDTANDCPHTAHTTYDVPLFIVGEQYRGAMLHDDGRLADIAPTMLSMLGIDVPSAMTGTPYV
ncbi:MAG: 2,3-bisphosphoglycerate-independent phosphoglycerate mutase [Planctomycetota bacterium]